MADLSLTDWAAEGDPLSPDPEDARVERIVLAFLIESHPSQLTIPELSRALNAHPGGFDSDDAVERAVRELGNSGLVDCYGGYAIPSQVSLYFAGLEMD